MWKTEDSGSSIMGVLFIIIVIWAIFGGGFGNGLGNRAYAAEGCSVVSNCQVEKQGIIDTARTQFLIEQTANKAQAENNANTQRLYDQSSRQYEAGLQQQIFDLKLDAQSRAILDGQEKQSLMLEVATLKRDLTSQQQFCQLNSKIDAIACETPKRPPYYAQGYVCNGQPIPQGFGNC